MASSSSAYNRKEQRLTVDLSFADNIFNKYKDYYQKTRSAASAASEGEAGTRGEIERNLA